MKQVEFAAKEVEASKWPKDLLTGEIHRLNVTGKTPSFCERRIDNEVMRWPGDTAEICVSEKIRVQ